MVNAWLAPLFTKTEPEGVIVPPAPAEAEMVNWLAVNVAVTDMWPVIVTVLVVAPDPSPDQPEKV